MLLEFTVQNFASYREAQTLSMRLVRSCTENATADGEQTPDRVALPVAVLYGANSSGKSNLCNAVQAMKNIVLQSIRLNDGDAIEPFNRFKLSTTTREQPTVFELCFLLDGQQYRYGFSYLPSGVNEEWLSKGETSLFERDGEKITINEVCFAEGIGKEKGVNRNRLFLSLVGQLGGKKANSILKFFTSGLHVLPGLEDELYAGFSVQQLENTTSPLSVRMKTFFASLQLGFNDMEALRLKPENIAWPPETEGHVREEAERQLESNLNLTLISKHHIYNEAGEVCGEQVFAAHDKESMGTKKLIHLSGPLFDILEAGSAVFIDELDCSLHPHIVAGIVGLFSDTKFNKKGAQLIFTTHDTNLLSRRLFRREQVWFAEKDKVEATDLYRLTDIEFPNPRALAADKDWEPNYLKGRYGAIPFINVEQMFKQ